MSYSYSVPQAPNQAQMYNPQPVPNYNPQPVQNYNQPQAYEPMYNQPLMYNSEPVYGTGYTAEEKKGGFPLASAGFVVGAGTGAFLGYRKNPYISGDKVNENFAVKAYNNYIEKATATGKDEYKQGIEILKKIDKVKSAADLKSLFDSNPKAAAEICSGTTVEAYMKNITDENLSSNIKTIKNKIESSNAARYQNIKNNIQSLWNSKEKKFVKSDGISQEIYDSVSEATKGMKAKLTTKFALIAGISGAVLGAVLRLVLSSRKSENSQNSAM